MRGSTTSRTVSSPVGYASSLYRTHLTRVFDSDNRLVVHAVQIALLIGAWYAAASVFPEDLMPFPLETLELVYQLAVEGVVLQHFLITFQRIIMGVVIAVIIGTIVGVLMGTSNYWKFANLPYVILLMTTPSIIWALAAIIVFGFGNVGVVFVAVVATVPWTTLQIWKGTENIRSDLIEMGVAFHLSRGRMFRRMIIPNIAPDLFAATRFGVGIAFKAIIVAEFMVTNVGIGAEVIKAYDAYQYQEAWAWALLILGIIFTIEFVLRQVEARIFRYRGESSLSSTAV